jgi:hypothetical protein
MRILGELNISKTKTALSLIGLAPCKFNAHDWMLALVHWSFEMVMHHNNGVCMKK